MASLVLASPGAASAQSLHLDGLAIDGELLRPEVERVTVLPVGERMDDPSAALLRLTTHRPRDHVRAGQLLAQRAQARRRIALATFDRSDARGSRTELGRARMRVAALEREADEDLRRAAAALESGLGRVPRPLSATHARGFVLLYRIYDRLDQRVRSRTTAERLVALCPSCPVTADARVQLGDAAFAERDVLAARDHYRAATDVVRADRQLRAYAHYKLAWCHRNLAEPERALDALMAARELTAGDRTSHALHREAARDALPVLAELQLPATEVVSKLHELAAGDADAAADLHDRYRRVLEDQGRAEHLEAFDATW